MYGINVDGKLVRVTVHHASQEEIQAYLDKQRSYAKESFDNLRKLSSGISYVDFKRLCQCGAWITGFLEPAMLALKLPRAKVIRVVENSSCYSFDVYTSMGKVVFMTHPALLDDSIQDAICIVRYRLNGFETVFNGVQVELKNILDKYLIQYRLDGKQTHCWESKGTVCEGKCRNCGNYHLTIDGSVYCLSYKNSFREAILKSKSSRFGFIEDKLIDYTK